MPVIPFSDEQLRVLVNLEQRYGVWIETERAISHLPYDLRRKQISGRSYLYEVTGRDGNGRSLGAWSPELEVRFTAYRAEKAALKTRREVSRAAVAETAADAAAPAAAFNIFLSTSLDSHRAPATPTSIAPTNAETLREGPPAAGVSVRGRII